MNFGRFWRAFTRAARARNPGGMILKTKSLTRSRDVRRIISKRKNLKTKNIDAFPGYSLLDSLREDNWVPFVA